MNSLSYRIEVTLYKEMDYKIDDQSFRLLREKLLHSNPKVRNGPPVVYAMAGIPGAGKTTYVNTMLSSGQFPKDAYLLSPDQVMELLPEYQRDYAQLGPKRAFKRWEMPARSAAYQLMDEAIRLRIDIIQDMGNARRENYRRLKKLKEQHGYYIKMYWIDIPIDIALERIRQRERFTPKSIVYKRFKTLSTLKPAYNKLVNEFITL